MLTQSKLIIDGGGTSSKGILLSSNEMLHSGPGNVSKDLDESVNSYLDIIKQAKLKFEIIGLKIYAAGFASLTDKVKKCFLSKIKDVIDCDDIIIKSDAVLPLDGYGDKTTSITIGTGTSIATNINKNIEYFYGLGHLIFEPMSGVGVMRRLIAHIYNQKNQIKTSRLLEKYHFNNYSDMLKQIYEKPMAKNIIAAPFYDVLNDEILKTDVLEILNIEFIIFNSKFIESILNQSNKVILNGSIAKNSLIVNMFRKKYPSVLFISNTSFLENAKLIGKKW